MRKTCQQSKDDNPDWGKKINLEAATVVPISITECFIGDGPKVMKFTDKRLSYGSGIFSYSCEGLIDN